MIEPRKEKLCVFFDAVNAMINLLLLIAGYALVGGLAVYALREAARFFLS